MYIQWVALFLKVFFFTSMENKALMNLVLLSLSFICGKLFKLILTAPMYSSDLPL